MVGAAGEVAAERRRPGIGHAPGVCDGEHRAGRHTFEIEQQQVGVRTVAVEHAAEVRGAADRSAEVAHVLEQHAMEVGEMRVPPAGRERRLLALAHLVAELGVERLPLRLDARFERELERHVLVARREVRPRDPLVAQLEPLEPGVAESRAHRLEQRRRGSGVVGEQAAGRREERSRLLERGQDAAHPAVLFGEEIVRAHAEGARRDVPPDRPLSEVRFGSGGDVGVPARAVRVREFPDRDQRQPASAAVARGGA